MPLNELQIGLLALGAIKLFIYLIFMGFYVKRIIQLDKLASNNMQRDQSLKIRIICISVLISLQVIQMVVSYTDSNYFMYEYKHYTTINILGIADFILQLYIITRQYKKKTFRTRSVLIMWISLVIQEVLTLIVIQVYSSQTIIILPILKIIISVSLIVLTLLLKPHSTQFRYIIESMRSKLFSPLIEPSTRYGKNSQRIYVQFNKQFQISLQKNRYEYSFKIAVYIYGKFTIITKSQGQFLELQKNLKELFPGEDIVYIKNFMHVTTIPNVIKFAEEKQKIYESFLMGLTKDQKYYVQPLMNFLEIKEKERMELEKYKKINILKESMDLDEEEKVKKSLFNVSEKDGKIHVSNPQILDFFINKPVQEIVAFHNRLLSEKKLKIQLLSQNPNSSQLIHFIYRVTNSKSLWRDFSQWMSLGIVTEDKIYSMFRFWNSGFDNLQMSVIGFETTFDQNNSMVYYYLLSINAKNSGKEGVMLKKRFNDFVKLDGNIKKYITNQGIKNIRIPSLPPRFSPFENKTSPNFRREYFDAYIKDIVKIQGINHCIKLLEFLQVNKINVAEHIKRSQSSVDSQRSMLPKIFDSINLDELEIQPRVLEFNK